MILFNNNSLFKSRIIWILFESLKTWTWNFKSQFEKFASFFPTPKVSFQKSFFSWSMIFKSRMGMEAHRIYKGEACGRLILPNYLNNYSISTYLGIVANSKLKLLNVQTRAFRCFLFKTGTVTECAHFKENPAKTVSTQIQMSPPRLASAKTGGTNYLRQKTFHGNWWHFLFTISTATVDLNSFLTRSQDPGSVDISVTDIYYY